MKDRWEVWGLRLLRAGARALPRGVSLAIGRALGRLAWWLGIRRRVVVDNVTRALAGTHDAQQRSNIARGAYGHLGMTCVEFLRLDADEAAYHARHCEWIGLEHLAAARAAGRGVIAASAHYGNWEVFAAAGAAHGLGVTLVVQELRNPHADELLNATRRAAGVRVLRRGMALRRVQDELEENRIVALMCDQDARRRGVFVPFFGTPASTHKGPVQLAQRLGVSIIPVFARRLHDGRHRFTFHPALEVRADNAADGLVETLTRLTSTVEAVVREEPAQYLWHHRRWKTTPDDARVLAHQRRDAARQERLRRHTSA